MLPMLREQGGGWGLLQAERREGAAWAGRGGGMPAAGCHRVGCGGVCCEDRTANGWEARGGQELGVLLTEPLKWF